MKSILSFSTTGIYKGAYPVKEFSEKFSKSMFAIETGDEYRPIQVFDLHKTEKRDNTELVKDLKAGDEIEVFFNLSSSENPKTKGQWFQNVVCWKIEKKAATVSVGVTNAQGITNPASDPIPEGDRLPF